VLTCLAVTSPAAEWSEAILVFDGAPEQSGAFLHPAFGRCYGKEPDPEDASGTIAELVCNLE